MDQADIASDIQSAEIEQALKTHEDRIKRGSRRSHCVDCGMSIQPARLSAIPYAARCVGCQMDHDRSHAWGV